MTIEDQIKDEKLQYDINREATKISALSSGDHNKDHNKDLKVKDAMYTQNILTRLR